MRLRAQPYEQIAAGTKTFELRLYDEKRRAIREADAILHKITDRITHEVAGINRVLYDLTPKPIGTIERE